jgi:hypothetical protein
VVETLLCLGVALKGGRSIGRERKWARARSIPKNTYRLLVQMDDMGFAVLCILGRNNPEVTIKVDVMPRHAADFVPALPGEGKEFHDRAERKPYSPITHNHGPEFLIGEYTMP